jgi:hypothetical protein
MTSNRPHSSPSTDPAYVARLLDARSTAKTVSSRLGGRQVRIRRRAFIRSDERHAVPPYVALLAGRGHTDKPMKLAVLASWMAGSEGGGDGFGTHFPPQSPHPFVGPFTSAVDYDDVADLLLLDHGNAETDRKIRRYLDHLAAQRLLAVSTAHDRILLLNEDGSGDAYTDPGSRTRGTAPAGAEEPELEGTSGADTYQRDDFYVTLPATFFRNGWFSAMPGSALLTLLVHLDLHRSTQPRSEGQRDRGNFVNDEFRRRYVPMSQTTYERGIRLLRNWGLVTTHVEMVRSGANRKSRNRYSIDLSVLQADAPAVPPERDPKLVSPASRRGNRRSSDAASQRRNTAI